QNVDIAVIETGLGGRLDSTNVINPILSIITNISLDHVSMLENSFEEIAFEKAGIIKNKIPVIISERSDSTSPIFLEKANTTQSKIIFASDEWDAEILEKNNNDILIKVHKTQAKSSTSIQPNDNQSLEIRLDLPGSYQLKNLKGVLSAVEELKKSGFTILENDLFYALSHVKELTGLRARWQMLSEKPLIICDTGHNEAGWEQVLLNINQTTFRNLHMVIGVRSEERRVGKESMVRF